MEKTLSMGAFTELDEREVMETEGGVTGLELLIIVPVVVGFAGAIGNLAKNVGNMNQVTNALNNLDEGETGSATCKDILGRPFEVTVTGGTSPNDYRSEATRLLR